MYEICDRDLVLAIGGSLEDMDNIGCEQWDYNKPNAMIQWGLFNLPNNKELQPHIHKYRVRQANTKTIEFLVVLSGELQCDYYGLNKQLVGTRVMSNGDWVCLYDGGHGFKALQSNTKMIEVKLGPFDGVDKDKEKFISNESR